MEIPVVKNRTSRFEETIRSFDVRRSEAEGPLSGGQGNLVPLIPSLRTSRSHS